VRDFQNPPYRPCGPPSELYNGYRVILGGSAAEGWRWPPTPSSAVVNEKVKLNFYFPSVPLWHVVVWILPLPLLVRYQVWSSAVCTEVVSDNLMNAGRLPWKRTEPPSYNSCFTHQFVYNYFILFFDKITWKQRLVTWKITQAINNHSIFSQPELYLLTGSFLWTGQLRGIKEYSIELKATVPEILCSSSSRAWFFVARFLSVSEVT
jgi:hypothetical protein